MTTKSVDGLPARVRAQTGRSLGQWAVLLFGLILCLLVGPALAVGGVIDDVPHLAVFGAVVSAIALMAALVLPAELRLGMHRPGARIGVGPDGLTATVVPRARWHVPHLVTALLIVVAWPAASAVVAMADHQAVLAVFLLAVAGYPASYLWPLLRGRVKAGGVYLTPEGITHVRHGGWWRVGWEDVVAALPGEPMAVVLRDGSRPEHGRRTRHPGWKGMSRSPAPNILGVETRYLALDPTNLAELITMCNAHLSWRNQLGTAESVAWVDAQLDRARRARTSD